MSHVYFHFLLNRKCEYRDVHPPKSHEGPCISAERLELMSLTQNGLLRAEVVGGGGCKADTAGGILLQNRIRRAGQHMVSSHKCS